MIFRFIIFFSNALTNHNRRAFLLKETTHNNTLKKRRVFAAIQTVYTFLALFRTTHSTLPHFCQNAARMVDRSPPFSFYKTVGAQREIVRREVRETANACRFVFSSKLVFCLLLSHAFALLHEKHSLKNWDTAHGQIFQKYSTAQ